MEQKLQFVLAKSLILPSENPLDFHAKSLSVPVNI